MRHQLQDRSSAHDEEMRELREERDRLSAQYIKLKNNMITIQNAGSDKVAMLLTHSNTLTKVIYQMYIAN